jgi:RNase adaptor protein for sRNA GlmZ degradation
MSVERRFAIRRDRIMRSFHQHMMLMEKEKNDMLQMDTVLKDIAEEYWAERKRHVQEANERVLVALGEEFRCSKEIELMSDPIVLDQLRVAQRQTKRSIECFHRACADQSHSKRYTDRIRSEDGTCCKRHCAADGDRAT